MQVTGPLKKVGNGIFFNGLYYLKKIFSLSKRKHFVAKGLTT